METTVVVQEVKHVKDGMSGRGPWSLYHVIDGNGDKFSVFNKGLVSIAEGLVGKKALLGYEENEKGRSLKEIHAVAEDAEPPALGTGEYVRGQTAPSDKASIRASVALKAAVDTLSHTIKTDATPKQASEQILPLAGAYDLWLRTMSGIEIGPDEDVPF
jgi:hypothetical protein